MQFVILSGYISACLKRRRIHVLHVTGRGREESWREGEIGREREREIDCKMQGGVGGIQKTSFQRHLGRNHSKRHAHLNHLEKGGEGELVVNQTYYKESCALAA